MVEQNNEEVWTAEDEAKWQAIQPLIRKRNRIIRKKYRDPTRQRKYSPRKLTGRNKESSK